MTEIVDLPAKGDRVAAEGTGRCPGRNRRQVGAWLAWRLIAGLEGFIVDVMCGAAQLWLDRMPGIIVYGCEVKGERAALARKNGIVASVGDAEVWTPPILPDDVGAVIFSPPFPNCRKMSGKNAKQVEKIEKECLHAMQDVGPMPNMMRVLQNVDSWRGSAPVAIICKNYIKRSGAGQAEINWTGELADMMTMLGMGPVEWFWYPVRPGRFEPGKRKKNPKHRIIDREIILIAPGRPRE